METYGKFEDGWRSEAACRDTDPDLFFPIGTTGPAVEQIENAKAVCRRCDVQAECLDFALATNQDSGIWGGTNEEERRKIAKQRSHRRRNLGRTTVAVALPAPPEKSVLDNQHTIAE